MKLFRFAALIGAALLLAIPAFAEDVVPAKHFPPTSYTLTLSPSEIDILGAVFPAAEMPQNRWGPVLGKIQQQVMQQNSAAQAADTADAKKAQAKK